MYNVSQACITYNLSDRSDISISKVMNIKNRKYIRYKMFSLFITHA